MITTRYGTVDPDDALTVIQGYVLTMLPWHVTVMHRTPGDGELCRAVDTTVLRECISTKTSKSRWHPSLRHLTIASGKQHFSSPAMHPLMLTDSSRWRNIKVLQAARSPAVVLSQCLQKELAAVKVLDVPARWGGTRGQQHHPKLLLLCNFNESEVADISQGNCK